MISNRCQYALRAVLELAKRDGSGRATISEIAREQKIPPRFLEAILRQLRQAGIAESVRGKEGGYVLARGPADITVGEIIELFEDPLTAVAQGTPRSAPAVDEVFREVWARAEKALSTVYRSVDFAELAERDLALRRKFVVDYVI